MSCRTLYSAASSKSPRVPVKHLQRPLRCSGVFRAADDVLARCASCSLPPFLRFAPYTARLAFADYWKDSTDQATYLERSRWLADVNNEREDKNAEYKRRMMTLQRYVLVEAVNDTTVAPHVSESHGFYAWGSSEQILPLRETEGYKKDWIGVRTLDESGRLVQLQYQGDHLQFTDEFWAKVVLPHLGP